MKLKAVTVADNKPVTIVEFMWRGEEIFALFYTATGYLYISPIRMLRVVEG